jgi:transmembrane sensor
MAQNNQITSLFVRKVAKIKHYMNRLFILKKIDSIIQETSLRNLEESIKEQASLWISRINQGLSQDETLDLYLWSKQSDLHRNSLFSLASLSDELTVLNELSALFPLEKPKTRRYPLLFKYAIAASITFFLLFASHLLINMAPFPDANNEKQFVEVKTLQTEIGQQTRFSLSDGSRIKLNTNSLVKVSYSKTNRLLTLIRGEANFNVAKDKSRPFTVTVGEKSFTALGTIFNIQKTSDENMELVVTEGGVLMTKSNELLDKIANKLSNFSKNELPGLLVTSGEIATIENNVKTLSKKISFEKIQRDLAWQQGMLVFSGETLDEALAEISRYTNTKFKINDAKLPKIKVAGYYKTNDIDGLLTSLTTNFNIQSEKIDNNTIHLSLNTSK